MGYINKTIKIALSMECGRDKGVKGERGKYNLNL